jgi:hypothetical protein
VPSRAGHGDVDDDDDDDDGSWGLDIATGRPRDGPIKRKSIGPFKGLWRGKLAKERAPDSRLLPLGLFEEKSDASVASAMFKRGGGGRSPLTL